VLNLIKTYLLADKIKMNLSVLELVGAILVLGYAACKLCGGSLPI